MSASAASSASSSSSISASIGTSVSAIAGAWASGEAAKLQSQINIAKIQSQGKASRENIQANQENYLRNMETRYEQIEAINRELGSVMSRQGLEAMKAEARLRTAGASTGLQGSSITEVSEQSGYDLLFDNQVAISIARNLELSTQRQLVADWLNFEAINRQQVSAVEGNVISGAVGGYLGAVLGGLGAGLEHYAQYGMSNTSQTPTYSDGSPMTNITPNE